VSRDSGPRPRLTFTERVAVAHLPQRKTHLEDLLRRGKLQGRVSHLILPLNSYQTMQLDLPDVPLSETRQAVRWQIGERIDYPAEQAMIDIYQIPPFAGERRAQSYAVAARRQALREHVDTIGAAGLCLQSIDIPEFALRNICELFADDPRGVALLLLLEQSGLFVVVREGVLYLSRQLSIGMNSLLAYDPEDSAIMSMFDTIVLDIQRSFDFCESSFQLPAVSRLLVAQTQQELPALVNYLRDYLTTPVEPLRLDDVMDVPAQMDQLDMNQQLLAIGGALRQGEK
jgi:MSHA biogenesis protein MshI